MLHLPGQLHLCRRLSLNASSITFQLRYASTTAASTSRNRGGFERIKYPQRGGQNLSDRYQRLQKSVRGKELFERRIADLRGDAGSAASPDKVRSSNVKTFMGFVVPEEPKEPSDEECCMSGCAVCVYDLYDEARTDYKKSVESLRSSLRLLNVPEDTWPQNIQTAPRKLTERKKSVTMSAFEELEMRLKQKQEQQAISVEDVPEARRSKGKKQAILPDASSVYEGLRWVIFSNR